MTVLVVRTPAGDVVRSAVDTLRRNPKRETEPCLRTTTPTKPGLSPELLAVVERMKTDWNLASKTMDAMGDLKMDYIVDLCVLADYALVQLTIPPRRIQDAH